MRSCTDWWISTKTNPNIFNRPAYQTDHVEDHLMAWPDVDAAVLAADLGLHVPQVKAAQRRLGLRKCAPNNPGHTSHIDMRGHNKPRKR
jgi:hypothetical protein